jgi:hypothetical protein
MRIETIQREVFTFAELSDDAKYAAKRHLNDEHFWGADSIASLEAFAAHFGVKVKNYNYGPWASADIETDAENANFRGFKLKDARALPDYPTDYCLDYSLREVFIREFERKGDALAAFVEAMEEGIREARADWEGQFDDDYMADHCDANGYEFTSKGALV